MARKGNYRRGAAHPQFKHGMRNSITYTSWVSMIDRCSRPAAANFHQYGGRGVTVCRRWRDFRNFLADMGPRPSKRHSLDRLDGTKGYTPRNCRWATSMEQGANRRTNIYLTVDGVVRSLAEWARVARIHKETLRSRLKNGWEVADAVWMRPGPKHVRYRDRAERGRWAHGS